MFLERTQAEGRVKLAMARKTTCSASSVQINQIHCSLSSELKLRPTATVILKMRKTLLAIQESMSHWSVQSSQRSLKELSIT